jgi:uncharacterized RDD family membrane protein YckC
MDDSARDSGLGSGLRRAVDDAFDATVGRVGHSVAEAAVHATGATAEQVIEGLEPYLVEQAIPSIVEGIRPYLSQTLVPGMLEDLSPQLVEQALPRILEDLRPYLETQLVPAVVDALMPHLKDNVAPELVDALMPKIEQEIAPRLVDALMPKIEQEIAPQIIDAVMPKIRGDVVPLIMNDIVEDPAVRDLIREQSQGLILDTLEGLRGTLAKADSIVDQVGRHVLRRPERPAGATALDMVLEDVPADESKPLRLAVQDLAAARAMWREQPAPPAPPGRAHAYGGAVTRLLGLAIDSVAVGWVAGQGLSALLNLLESIFGALPSWVGASLALMAGALFPMYLAISYWTTGRSLGMAAAGLRVCTPDGRRLPFVRSMVRAWALVLGLVIWLVSGFASFVDPKRRSVLDMLMHTEVRYSVPDAQQRRHIRDAVRDLRKDAD